MLEKKLRSTLNAKIFRAKSALSENDIRAIFKDARGFGAITIKSLTRENFEKKKHGKYSLHIFKREANVSFLSDNNYKELHYGYILIVENGDLVFVFSKRARDFSEKLLIRSAYLGEAELINGSLTDGSNITRLRATTVTPGTVGKSSKVFSGSNLQSGLGSVFNNRSQLQNLGAVENGKYISLNFPEGKISQYGKSVDINRVGEWALKTKESINLGKGGNKFASTFAKVRRLEEAGAPRAIYFHLEEIVSLLTEKIKGGRLQLQKNRRSKKSEYVAISDDRADTIIKAIYSILADVEIAPHPKKENSWVIIHDSGTKVKTIGYLRAGKNKFQLHLARLNKYLIQDSSEKFERLTTTLSKGDCFSLSFENPEYFYISPMTMSDSRFKNQATELLNHIEVYKPLSEVTSEKGVENGNNKFSDSSIFGKWDKQIKSKKNALIICDDDNTEWADFIHFDNNGNGNLEFVHMKHDDVTGGAAKFHVVVAQAIKHIGELFRTSDHYVEKLCSKWSAQKILGCDRIRHLDGFNTAQDCINSVIQNGRFVRTNTLIVSFLSKSQFETSLNSEPMSDITIQRVWLLSAFVNLCLERGVIPKILCLE